MEGFIFPTKNGYKRTTDCSPMKDVISKYDKNSDLTVMLGECSVVSGIDALAATGIMKTFDINQKGIGSVDIGVVGWNGSKTEFAPGKVTIGAGIHAKTVLLGQNMDLTGDVTVELSMSKKYGLTKKPWLNHGLSFKNKNLRMREEYPGVLLDTDAGTFTIHVNLVSIQNLSAPDVPEPVLALLMSLLKNQKFDTDVTIPSFCVADGACMSSVDMAILDEYIVANGNVGFGI